MATLEQLVSGTNRNVEMEWRSRWFRDPTLSLLNPSRRETIFALSDGDLAAAPTTTRQSDAGARFKAFAESVRTKSGKSFWGTWLEARGADPVERLVTLKIARSGRWDLPWELLLADTEPEQLERLAIVRMSGNASRASVRQLPQRLKIHLLVGDDRGLRLAKEARTINAAITSLDYSANQRLYPFTWEVADPDKLHIQIANAAPDILWFGGHGGSQQGIRLYFRGDRELTAKQFARSIQKSGHIPLYCVFNACELGRGEKDAYDVLHPVLFEALEKIGVLSVVAMQAPIGDNKAIRFAGRIVSELAAGSTLEWAVARGRGALLGSWRGEIDEHAWATPTTWSAGRPQRTLTWKTEDIMPVAAQLLGRTSFQSGETDREFVDEAPDDWNRQMASRVIAGERLWLCGDPSAAEHQRGLVLILKAVQLLQAKPTILVTLAGSGLPQLRLRTWWEEVSEWSNAQNLPAPIVEALEAVRSDPELGWRMLTDVADMFLAVSGPPGADAVWFWDPLNIRPQPVVILAESAPSPSDGNPWETESMNGARTTNHMSEVLRRAPRLARALAVLNRPIHFEYLNTLASEDDSCPRYEEWEGRDAVVVESAGRPMITASARRAILSKLGASPSESRQSVIDALRIICPPRYDNDPAMQVRRMELLVEAGEHSAAVLEADALISTNERKGRWATALNIAARLGDARKELTNTQRLDLANACIQLGYVGEAQDSYLRRVHPVNSSERARKLAIEAEIYKSESHFGDAVTKLDEAIAICVHDTSHDKQQLLMIRQDMTRLLHYFEHQFDRAAQEYAAIIEELTQIADSEHEIAVVKRNYGECLRSLCEQGDDRFDEAKLLLRSAASTAAVCGDGSLESECYYQLASLARVRGKVSEVSKWLNACETTATKCGDRMIEGIVRARKFWRRVLTNSNWDDKTRDEWIELAAKLNNFQRHGWSMRTLQNGYLYQALLEIESNRPDLALQVLLANRRFFESHPAYDRNRDRERIAWTYAGLATVEYVADGDPWNTFQERHEWSSTFLRPTNGKQKSVADVWNELKSRWKNG